MWGVNMSEEFHSNEFFQDQTSNNSYDNRFSVRRDLNLEIYYPIVNNESLHEKFKFQGVAMYAINISTLGVSIKSKFPLKLGDILNFTLKFSENPSFWCMAEVKWVKNVDDYFLAGCEFHILNDEQIKIIRDFVNAKN